MRAKEYEKKLKSTSKDDDNGGVSLFIYRHSYTSSVHFAFHRKLYASSRFHIRTREHGLSKPLFHKISLCACIQTDMHFHLVARLVEFLHSSPSMPMYIFSVRTSHYFVYIAGLPPISTLPLSNYYDALLSLHKFSSAATLFISERFEMTSIACFVSSRVRSSRHAQLPSTTTTFKFKTTFHWKKHFHILMHVRH